MYNSKKWVWFVLFSRLFLFVSVQALVALFFYIIGNNESWNESEKWWPFVVTTTNLICFMLLLKLFKADGKNYFKIFEKINLKRDYVSLILVLLMAAPIGFLPNVLLSNLLFDDPMKSVELLIRPLPLFGILIALILFPITQGLVEIPLYFSYVMPKLKEQGFKWPLALGLPAVLLGLQHIAVPLIFNWDYLLWRGLMYLPFAFLVGIIIRLRPRLLTFLAIMHVLMDLSFAMMYLI